MSVFVRISGERVHQRKNSRFGSALPFFICTLCFFSVTFPAIGQTLEQAIQISLPAGGLADALDKLGDQSGVQIMYDPALAKGIQVAAVSGKLTISNALNQLLAKTGLKADRVNDKTVVLRRVEAKEPPPDKSAISSPSKPLDTANENTGVLEEVVVTATRREESLEHVPISISALSQADLYAGGIKGIDEIATITPGLQLAVPYGASYPSLTTISIRGLNTLSGASVVGVYLDDTPISIRLSPSTNVGTPYPAVFDLNRVEVERGPQGTLFGAGSEAGTVRFITNQPSLTEFSGFAHSELATTQGGTESYEIGAAFGGPIAQDTVGFRVSVWDRHDGGYVDRIDPITGAVVAPNDNQDDKLAIKAALAFHVHEGTLVTPSVFYQSIYTGDIGTFYGNFSNPSAGEFENGRLLPAVSTDRLLVPSVKVESHLSFADFTSVSSYTHRTDPGSLDLSPLWGEYGFVNYGNPLGPGFPSTLADVAPFFIEHSVNALTEELRLASNRPDAFVTWVGGIFLDHRRQVDSFQQYSTAANPAAPLMSSSSQPATDNQAAVFAQGDFHVTKTLTATLGERVASVVTELSTYQGGLIYVGQPPFKHVSSRETPSTPRLALTYQPDQHNLFYVSASEGFRAGGGNGPLANECPQGAAPSTYQADHVWSYEVGAKNGFFDGRLQIDSSVFHIVWRNIQQLEYIPSCAGYYTTNTGGAVSNGFDLAVQALVTYNLRLNLDAGYANAYYSSTVYDSAGAPLVLSGDKIGTLPQVNPPWDVNGAATYEIPLSSGNRIHLRGEYQYHSRNPGPFVTQVPTSLSYFPLLRQNPATQQFNARVGTKINKLDLNLFVTNIFNAHPLLGMYQDTPTTNLITYSTFRPRTVGVSANIEF
jgi:iron complex outermembrane recepter protein